ncbi:hypothetical protein NQZ68_016632 [Dissostichus eleginoides]|nr:hypothetical protein NQZ68_016632 [Dissostichus eleginoides]
MTAFSEAKFQKVLKNYDYAEELRFYLIHMTEKCDCLLSLEVYSADQKRRVCQCLKDNIDKQLQLHRREASFQHFDEREQEGAEHTALGDSVFNTRVEVEKTTDLNCLGSSIQIVAPSALKFSHASVHLTNL